MDESDSQALELLLSLTLVGKRVRWLYGTQFGRAQWVSGVVKGVRRSSWGERQAECESLPDQPTDSPNRFDIPFALLLDAIREAG